MEYAMVNFLASCTETLAPGISSVFYTSVLVTFLLTNPMYQKHISHPALPAVN